MRPTDPLRLFDSAADEASDAESAFGLAEVQVCIVLRTAAARRIGLGSDVRGPYGYGQRHLRAYKLSLPHRLRLPSGWRANVRRGKSCIGALSYA